MELHVASFTSLVAVILFVIIRRLLAPILVGVTPEKVCVSKEVSIGEVIADISTDAESEVVSNMSDNSPRSPPKEFEALVEKAGVGSDIRWDLLKELMTGMTEELGGSRENTAVEILKYDDATYSVKQLLAVRTTEQASLGFATQPCPRAKAPTWKKKKST